MSDKYYQFFCCPDDRSKLHNRNTFLECSECGRYFPILAGNFFEILPSEFPAWDLAENENKEPEKDYQQLYREPFTWNITSGGWGGIEICLRWLSRLCKERGW